MAKIRSIYKSAEAKKRVLDLYESKEKSLNFPFEKLDIKTSFGNTRVISAGNDKGKTLVLFHGIHAGSPLTLQCIENLLTIYKVYAIDTIGQATKSDETTINIKDDSFANWADEVLEVLSIEKANFIGISYGAFILQKLITYKPLRINKCIFIVPSGLANGAFWPSMKKLTIPLIKFHFTKKDDSLKNFIQHFVPDDDEYMFQFQKAILLGVHMDYRRPAILKEQDVSHFTNEVYMIVADDDVFFPAEKTVSQANKVFNNLQVAHVLKGCKHMPHPSQFIEIENKIKEWVN